ncbi:MAG: TetR/AcrR family transcriptional regulator [Actinobacteria bacterium]|nr:TetR/AcrR family transcriptional regulator [Actinomycetota bacterium]
MAVKGKGDKSLPSAERRRRQRSDARQNVVAIVRAATEVLSSQPDASVDDIAKAAGLSRQTVYAHFPSREALLDAVIEGAAAETAAAFDGAGLEGVPPAEAVIRLLDAGWRVVARYPFLWLQPGVSHDKDAERHGPLLERLSDLIRRGQESGDFDPTLSPEWLLTAGLALGRAAEEEVKAGRMSIEEASSVVHRSFLRLFGIM